MKSRHILHSSIQFCKDIMYWPASKPRPCQSATCCIFCGLYKSFAARIRNYDSLNTVLPARTKHKTFPATAGRRSPEVCHSGGGGGDPVTRCFPPTPLPCPATADNYNMDTVSASVYQLWFLCKCRVTWERGTGRKHLLTPQVRHATDLRTLCTLYLEFSSSQTRPN